MIQRLILVGFVAMCITMTLTGVASAGRILGGFLTGSVTCEGVANVSNIDKNAVSVACTIDGSAGVEVLLVCQNPGGNVNININNAFVPSGTFTTALSGLTTAEKKGKTTFRATSDLEGTQWTTTTECELDPNCVALRTLCSNPNWLPIDAIPLAFTGVMSDYYCDSDGIHQCSCDPGIPQFPADPDEVHRCATNLGGGNPPWSFNWDLTGGVLVPLASATYSCVLPNPETYQFGEVREYNCTQIN